VPKDNFTLITPWDAVKTYTFGTGVAKHYFCGTCGISPFYIPRSNPNGYSVQRPGNRADQRSIFDVSIGKSLGKYNGTTLMDKTGRRRLRTVISERELDWGYLYIRFETKVVTTILVAQLLPNAAL